MNKELEKKLFSRYELGDLKAAFELAHLLARTYQYNRYKEIIKFFTIVAKAGISESMFGWGLFMKRSGTH